MSIVIVALDGAPKVSAEAQKRDADLDARLEAKIKGNLLVISQDLLHTIPGLVTFPSP